MMSKCAVMASDTFCHLLFRFIESPVKPKQLKRGFFGWVWPTLQYSEQDMVQLNGTDAALYIRVQRFGGCTWPSGPMHATLQCPAAGLQISVTGTDAISHLQAWSCLRSARCGAASSSFLSTSPG